MSSCVFDFNSCAIKSEVTKTMCSALSLYTEPNHNSNSISETLSKKPIYFQCINVDDTNESKCMISTLGINVSSICKFNHLST